MKNRSSKALGGLGLGLAFALTLAHQPALANLYNLGNFTDSSSKVVDTETGSIDAGFTFQIQTGYQATFTKIGFWVKDVTFNNARATISLYDITDVSPVGSGPGVVLFTNQLILGDNTPGVGCSLSNGLDRNDFCFLSYPTAPTLVAGRTYALTSGITDAFGNENTFYAKSLINPGEFLGTVSNVIWGNPYSGNGVTYVETPGDQYGYFGANLGDFQVTAVPSPGAGVPAPLPVLGASAAFAYSRKIRARLKKSV